MATEFIVTVDPDTADTVLTSASLSIWEGRVNCDLTHATQTKVFSHGGAHGNAIPATTSLIGGTSGATGTCAHCTPTQILINGISGTFQSGEEIRKVGTPSDHVHSTDAGNRPIAVAECKSSAGSADTTPVLLSGWAVDSTYYIIIRPAASDRHAGKWNTAKYRLSTNASGSVLEVAQNYTRILNMQIESRYKAETSNGIYQNGDYDGGGHIIAGNIVKGPVTDNYQGCFGIIQPGYLTRSYIYNNIIYDWISADNTGGHGIINNNVGTLRNVYYNNTVYNCGKGIEAGSGSAPYAILKNNIVNLNTGTGAAYGGSLEDSNAGRNISSGAASVMAWGKKVFNAATSDATPQAFKLKYATGGLSACKVGQVVKDSGSNYSYITLIDSDTVVSLNNDIIGGSETFTIWENIKGTVTFVDASGRDLHIGSADTMAKSNGFNLSADAVLAFTSDIDGPGNRPSGSTAWTVGADEYTAPVFAGYGEPQEFGQEIGQEIGNN